MQNKTLTAISRALGWADDQLSVILLSSSTTARRPVEASAGRDPSTAETLARLETVLGQISTRLAAIEQVLQRD